MKKEKTEDLIIRYNSNFPSYGNITLAFDRLIGALGTATVFENFKKYKTEYKKILDVILKWSAEYELNKNLSFINHIELLDIYYKLVELNNTLICNSESELSDKIVIWYWELMLLRKAQIERLG